MIKTWQQRCEEHPDHDGIVTEQMIRDRMQEEIDELRQALAQHVDAVNISAERVEETAKREQEPVAWMGVDSYGNVTKFRTNEFGGGIPLYTAPPMIRDRMQEEIDELRQALAQPEQEPVAWANLSSEEIVAKLKEKNT